MYRLIILLFFVVNTTKALAQWNSLNSGTNEFLTSISFIDENNGFCISESGVMRKTTDGGSNWNLVATVNGFKTLFLDAQTGFVFGYNEIYKTVDGGNNWINKHTIDVSQSIGGIFFIDQNIGYAASANFTDSLIIYKTTDGGENWSFVGADLTNVAWLNVLYFKDANNGFIGNVDGQLLKTTDGGLNWTTAHFTTSMVYDIVFENATNGYAVSEMNFLKTTDGGATWTESTPSFSPLFLALDITPNNTIHLVGGDGFNTGTLIKSIDSGTSWQQSGTNNQTFYDVCFINDTIGFACGTGGSIIKFGSVTLSISEKTDLEFTIYPNPTTGIFTINYPSSNKDQNIYIHVYNNIGQKLISETFLPHSLDLSLYPNGIYFLVVKTNEGVFREKIVKN